MVQRPSVVHPSVRRPSLIISNIFFSKTACPIKAKFYVEPPKVRGTKVCSRHLGHMTKTAAMPIYGKNPSKSSSPEPAGRFSRNLVCNIGDSSPSKFVQMMTWSDLDLFYGKVKFGNLGFSVGKRENSAFFRKDCSQ